MHHFYVTLPSDSSGYYFPANTIADFRTKLATPLELEHDKLEVVWSRYLILKDTRNVFGTIHFV